MGVTTADAEAQATTAAQERRLAVVLVAGTAIWLVLLLAGFFAPGGWTWGMAGPVGHIENYMISLWLVTLINAPLIAAARSLALRHAGSRRSASGGPPQRSPFDSAPDSPSPHLSGGGDGDERGRSGLMLGGELA